MEPQYEICRLYKLGYKPLEIISRYPGLTREKIYRILKATGIPRRTQSEATRKYSRNSSYFSIIDSHEKAQLIGFIAADGCVSERRYQKVLNICLHEQDEDYLNYIKSCLKYAGPVKPFCNQFGCNYRILSISDSDYYADLTKLGLTPRKSLTLQFPDLPNEFLSSFVCGYFEGDGSISLMHHRRQSVNWEIGICVTKEFGDRLQLILKDKLDINSTLSRKKSLQSRNVNSYMLRFAGNKQVKRFGDWIYQNVPFKMARKYAKFVELSSHYDTDSNYLRPEGWKEERSRKQAETMKARGRDPSQNQPKECYFRCDEGTVYHVRGISTFAREMKLSGAGLSRLSTGQQNKYREYVIATPDQIASASASGTLVTKFY